MNLSFLEAARESPKRIAVVHGGDTYSFAAFAPFVRGAIRDLVSRGLAGQRIGAAGRPENGLARTRGPLALLTASSRIETLAHLYALMELGIPFVPLHERLSARERSAIIDASAPAIVLDDPLPAARAPGGATDEGMAGAGTAGAPRAIPNDERPLAVVFTSGTSGRPKGVVLSRAAFVASAEASAANLGWEEDDCWALSLPLAHIGGLSIVTRSLLARRAVFLGGPFDAAALACALDGGRITLLSLVPAMVRRLLDLEPRFHPSNRLRAVLVGGGAFSAPLLEEGLVRGLPLLPSYGLTETCSQVAAWPYGTRPTAPAARALKGAEIRIRDGRIQVRGPMLFSSYFGEGADASSLLEGGWFDTADSGRIDEDGFLRVRGRADDLLVTGGENVSPIEVEEEIARFPGVRAACVFALPDDPWGDLLAAALVVESEDAFDRDAFAAHLAGLLAPFKRPRRIALLPSLPTLPSGKIDRRAAAEEAKPHLTPLGAASRRTPRSRPPADPAP